MSSIKDLNSEQIAQLSTWAEAGHSLSEMHRLMESELELKMTYLDARLLVSELELHLQDKHLETKKEEPQDSDDDLEVLPPDPYDSEEPDPTAIPHAGDDLQSDLPPSASNVTLSLDQIAQPHAIVSGKATFSDGQQAAWYLDQMGRLGLDPDTEGYQPSPEDVQAFQTELQALLKTQGF